MIYAAVLGIPVVLLVVHMLQVLSQPSVEGRAENVQTSIRPSARRD